MFQVQKIAKFVILPYQNALPIKFNLKLGSNMVGNTQEHDVCINNRQIVKDHCCIDVSENEIELLVLDGPVYYKTEDGQYELLTKDSIITLNPSSQDYSIRLGKTVQAKVQIDNPTQFSIRKNQEQSQQVNQQKKQFDLQSKLSNIQVKVVESLYNSPKEYKYLEQFQIDQNSKFTLQEEEVENQENNQILQEKQNEEDQQNNSDKKLNQLPQNIFPFEEVSLNQNNLFKDQNNNKINILPCSQILQDLNNQITNEQTIETRSIGTPDFNNDSKQVNSKKKKTKVKQQKTLDYLIIDKKNKQIASPKLKTHQKLQKEIKKESVRLSVRRCSRWRYNIAFSGFHPNREEQQFLLLQNVQICLEDYNFNILIMEDNVELRTVKLLVALSKGIPIISREWLNRCINQYEMLDYNPYYVQFSANFCKDYQFNIKQYKKRLEQCQQNKILPLNNVNIFAPKRIRYHIEHFELECLVESLGGKIITQIPDQQELDNIFVFIPKDQDDLNGFEQIKKIPIENLFKTALKYKNSL